MSNGTIQGVTVEVCGLRKSYGGQPVLKGIDFKVERGEIFVIMGPSGSGKSVLLKHIIGLETPDEGELIAIDTPERIRQNPDPRIQKFLTADFKLNNLQEKQNEKHT